MATRYNKTLADYLVIAISPALIMALVGSLVFFLLEVFYQGNFGGRLHYILTLFVFAAVLIGRISIEEGSERAVMFALPLGAATLLAIVRFVQFQGAFMEQASFVINFGLLGLIWWCAHRLTWDCTMIDETDPASGEGLLDAAGLGQRVKAEAEGSAKMDPQVRPKAARPTWMSILPSRGARRTRRSILKSQGEKETQKSIAPGADDDAPSRWNAFRTPRGKPHSPGVWVIYFSLAALPIFGLGQLAIPAANEGRRHYVFCLLAVYVASGLGLLLTTSFLGLRRYLRQRRLPMPMIMTGTWIVLGCLLIVAVMGLALLLPRPNAEFAVSQIPHVMGSPDQKPSPDGMGRDGVKGDEPGHPEADDKDKPPPGSGAAASGGQAEKKPDGQAADSGTPDRAKPDDSGADSASGPKNNRGPKSSADGGEARRQADNRSGGKQGRGGKSKTGTPAEKKPETGQGSPPPEHSPPEPSPPDSTPPIDFASAIAWLLPVLQVAFYVVVAGLVAYWAWRHRAGILAALRDLLAGFRTFWQQLFDSRKKSAKAANRGPPRPRRFADFADPFATGMANQLSSDQLVRYLFEAVEAWGRENGCPREPEQTPHEFARGITRENPAIGPLATCLADLYCQAAYAPGKLTIANTQPLQDLWLELKKSSSVADEPWLAGA